MHELVLKIDTINSRFPVYKATLCILSQVFTMSKRNRTSSSNDTIETGQHFMIVNAIGCELIESRGFHSAERRIEVKLPCKKKLDYFCANESWGTVTQILLDDVFTLNVCNVHYIDNKRVYYQLRIHRRNLSEYKGVHPVAKRTRCSLSDVDYDSDASVSVSQTDSEGDNDTESESESEASSESDE